MSRLQELIQELCPDGVDYKRLRDISSKIVDGMHNLPKGLMEQGQYPVISAQNIVNGIIDLKSNKFASEELFLKENARTQIQKNDILLTIVGAVGRTAVVEDQKMLFQRSVCVITPDQSLINPWFLKYVLDSSSLQEWMKTNAHGAAQKGLYLKQVESIIVPVPPLEVQQEIVRILDSFTELTAELQAELQARKKQYEYYRNKLFLNARSVKVTTLDKISENCDSMRRPVTSGNRISGNIPYYGASGVVDYVRDYIFDGDYLLISEDGANLLARNTPIAFSISGKSWVNNHAHVLKFAEYATRRYVEIYLNSVDLSNYITGAAQPKLNQKNLNQIEIPLPPLKEQSRIVSILDRFDTLCNDLTTGLPAEIAARQKQYEYYRDKLLTFPEKRA